MATRCGWAAAWRSGLRAAFRAHPRSPAPAPPFPRHRHYPYPALPCTRGAFSTSDPPHSHAPPSATPPAPPQPPHPGRLSPSDVEELVDHVTRRRIKSALAESGRQSIPVHEYLALARRNGLDGGTAQELLSAMHKSGAVLYMPRAADRELRETVVLDTRGLTMAVTSVLEMSLETEIARETEAIRGEMAPYLRVWPQIDRNAKRHADLVSFGGLSVLLGQFGLFVYLTFVELSWDIMEPITYFASQVTIIGTYMYFLVMKRNHTYEDLWQRARRYRSEKLFRAHGLSYDRFQELRKELASREARLQESESWRAAATSTMSEPWDAENRSAPGA